MAYRFRKAKSAVRSQSQPKKRKNHHKLYILIAGVIIVLALAIFDLPAIWNKPAAFLDTHFKSLHIPQYTSRPFLLGLDLQGGASLVYQADMSNIAPQDQASAMDGVRSVIVRRVNLFGVSEPVVQTEKVGNQWRLLVDLAGIKNVNQAIQMIGQTPYLQFKVPRTPQATQQILAAQKKGQDQGTDPYFTASGLDGRDLKSAALGFDNTTYKPLINLQFNAAGTQLFAQITRENVGKQVAIYLDGVPLSEPTVQEPITGGQAQITGDFTVNQAKSLVEDLNAGALPVPITLISQNTVGASLGQDSLTKIIEAGLAGLVFVILFMLFYYRMAGLVASLALLVYAVITLAIFKLLPVTLTLSGIAGFVLSVGMAVDANILIFERMKEELRADKTFSIAVSEGFKRAWTSIRDSNFSTLISSLVLYSIGQDFVKGFALTLGLGVLVSMFTAVVVSHHLLEFFIGTKAENNKYLWRR